MKRWVIILAMVGAMLPSLGHAALVERLMGWPGFQKILVHEFYGLNNERIQGRQTRQNVIDALGLTGDDITEYDALVALAPTGSTAIDIAQKSMYLYTIHAVFLLGETRPAGYSTPAELRAKLGLP